ncbi:hypothetical protein WME90_30825 [Sorangium sp. So ce375]|uniref:hypothetical protein n=1 Tax=Sorangium sp. So ce375 TaxID=3133306 RepID=UPI003F5C3533
MQTLRFFLAGMLTVFVALPGCGDDGDGGSGATTSSSTGGDGGGGSAPEVSCSTYCTAIMANCSGDGAQYSNQASCEAFCANLPEGTAGDTTGNSLACRAYHADAAKTDAPTHCIHAGPSGGDVCGTAIETFCEVAPAACPEVYADKAACDAEAAGFDNAAPYTGPGSMGDTLACRLYHLTEAAALAVAHCPHIGESSPVCIAQ